MKYIKVYEQAQPEKSVKYYANGSIEYEAWYQNGNLHREDGPAWIRYRPDGSVEIESWYRNGERHREDGPAFTEYRPDGSVEIEEWYWHDEQLEDITSLEDFRAWQYLKSVGLV